MDLFNDCIDILLQSTDTHFYYMWVQLLADQNLQRILSHCEIRLVSELVSRHDSGRLVFMISVQNMDDYFAPF